MDPFTIVTEGLRKIFELREAIKRQKRVNYQTYMRLMQIRVELELSEQPLQSNATLQHSETMVKFAKAVDRFLKYLQKNRAMHRIGRVFKYSEMEDERLDIVDEIDQLFKMLNLATFVTVTNLEASEAANAAHFRAKLEHMHGDIKLTHDQVQAALQQLVEKRNTEMAKQKKQVARPPERKTSSRNETARPRVLTRQPPIRRKYSAIDLDDDVLTREPAEKNTNMLDTGEKLPIEVKMRPASPEPQGKPEPSPASNTKEEDALINQKHIPDLEPAAQQSPSTIAVEEKALPVQKSVVVENTPCGDLMEEKVPVETEKSTATVVLAEPEAESVDGVDETVVVNWNSLVQRITANAVTCEAQPIDPEPTLKPRTSLLDNVSVPLIIQKLGSGQATAFQQEQSLFLLITKCASSNNRVQVYKAGGIQVLERLVQNTESFVVQLYALHCLNWFTFSYSKMRQADFTRLRGCVREATHPEILSVLHELQDRDENVKEAAVIRCSCLATSGNGDNLRRAGVLPLLIAILTNGTANQKLWAAETLETLASNNDESCAEIAREGGIPPLVTLLRSGSDMHKQEAAYALGSMAANDDETRAKIAREGAIPPMVAFVKAVTDAQSHWAVYALGMLSSNNEANRVLIAEEGAIAPLVALLRDGTRAQKQWAAYTLGNLAYNNDVNRWNMTKEGAIAPLIKLLQVGTDSQKQWAAYAMGNLACDNDAVMDLDEAILPLVGLVRTGSDSQKQGAAYTLGILASNNDGSRVEIGRQGAIKPLVALLRSGTDEQKKWAAYAVGCIAKNNDENRAAAVQEGAIAHLAVLVETGTEDQQAKATSALELLTCDDSPNIHIMSPWMDYLRAEVNAQAANAVAALSTFETVREGVMPLLQSLVKDPKMQPKAIQPAPLDLKEGTRLQDTADAW